MLSKKNLDNTYFYMTIIYGISAAAIFVLLLLYVTDLKILDIFLNRYFLIIFIGLAVRLIALRVDIGFSTDIDCFKSWAMMV